MLGCIDLSDLSRIEFWKFWPTERRSSPTVEVTSPHQLEALRQVLLSANRSDYYGDDLEAPRFFVRLLCGDHFLAGSEVHERFAFFGEECLDLPAGDVWNLLEGSLASHPSGGVPDA